MTLSDQDLVQLRNCLISSAQVTNEIAAILRRNAAALDKSTKVAERCAKMLKTKSRPRSNGNGDRKSGTQ